MTVGGGGNDDTTAQDAGPGMGSRPVSSTGQALRGNDGGVGTTIWLPSRLRPCGGTGEPGSGQALSPLPSRERRRRTTARSKGPFLPDLPIGWRERARDACDSETRRLARRPHARPFRQTPMRRRSQMRCVYLRSDRSQRPIPARPSRSSRYAGRTYSSRQYGSRL